MSYQKNRDEFVDVIVSEISEQSVNGNPVKMGIALARLILHDAATIQRLVKMACERDLTVGAQRRKAACERRIREACAPRGIVPHFNGDPRGGVVRLSLPSRRWDSFDEAENCRVPTR